MTRWEYKTEYIYIPERLDELGLLGWELVHITHMHKDMDYYYFKRAINE